MRSHGTPQYIHDIDFRIHGLGNGVRNGNPRRCGIWIYAQRERSREVRFGHGRRYTGLRKYVCLLVDQIRVFP